MIWLTTVTFIFMAVLTDAWLVILIIGDITCVFRFAIKYYSYFSWSYVALFSFLKVNIGRTLMPP